MEAFEVEAFDYILKPYNEARIINLLAKLEAQTPPAAAAPAEAPAASRTVNLVKGDSIIVTPASRSTTPRPTRKSPWSTPRTTAT